MTNIVFHTKYKVRRKKNISRMGYMERLMTLLKINQSFKAMLAVVHPQLALEHKVFVYGTLKRNERNNRWLTSSSNGKANYLCEGKTSEKYPLVMSATYDIPFLLKRPGVGHYIKGEIWEMDESMLHSMDRMEKHPHFYHRQKDTIIPSSSIKGEENMTELECWVYFKDQILEAWLSRPMLENYTSAKI